MYMFQLTPRQEPVVDSTKFTAADVRIVSKNHLAITFLKFIAYR